MISFAQLTKQVHLINDLILTDMICDSNDTAQSTLSFSQHLPSTKYWFARISWVNKKRYLLALLEDVSSAWTLSLLLKSMWNCRPKDSVLSISDYDQVPMDHNRTAIPVTVLAQVMKNDRIWFLTLEPERQAMVLSELLTVSGGPIMWSVLRRGQLLYERYCDQQINSLLECVVVNDPPTREKSHPQTNNDKGKRDQTQARKPSAATDTAKQASQPGQAQRELEANLAAWNATIKSMRDNLKLEELEMTFKDGTKRKIWKVNRPKPEVIETVDFLQLLPSSIGKRILSYLPRTQLGDYARVNKYWAYLVDDFRAELNVRQKIQMDFEKLNDAMLRHDTSMEMMDQNSIPMGFPSSQGFVSLAPSVKTRHRQSSVKPSEKSGAAYSFRHFLSEKLNKPTSMIQTPVRNVGELTECLERRGAVDQNLWTWCENILKNANKIKKDGQVIMKHQEGVLSLGNVHFPCSMMKHTLEVPLDPPLYKDPAMTGAALKTRRSISYTTVMHTKDEAIKKYSLWTRDFSSLYPVFKIPSHLSPF